MGKLGGLIARMKYFEVGLSRSTQSLPELEKR